MSRGMLKLALGLAGLLVVVFMVGAVLSPQAALAAKRPVITKVTPSSGPSSGGTHVHIAGSNFRTVTKVTFGAKRVKYVATSSRLIGVVAPPGSSTVTIRVTTRAGTSAAASAARFTYVAPAPSPTVSSLTPSSGPAAGGTSVTIGGSGLSGATAVTFGGTAAASYSVISDSTVSAVSPPGSGAVDVRVTTPGGTSATSDQDVFTYVSAPTEQKTIKVAIVNFDPYCPNSGNRRTHEVMGWNDAGQLASGYITDLLQTSGGFAQYQIVSRYDADYHPYFQDGFHYDPDVYVDVWNNDRANIHGQTGDADYVRILTDKSYPHNQPLSLAERVAAGEIDEVFLFGSPGAAAFWEASMAGPSPFFVNGGTYSLPAAGRNFVVMGFNYERDVDCMLEDFCHRSECIMTRAYDPLAQWVPTWPPANNWDKFRMYDQIKSGEAACGTTHFAPNSTSDYDWGNATSVMSTCDDWLNNWPNLQGASTKRLVTSSEWGGGDMRLHHVWWLNHIPKAPGVNPDGKQNNWWKYLVDFSSYPESQ